MCTVLLVEDNDDVREMMAIALELGGGHEVWPVANGLLALTMLEGGRRPSLILVDLMMPVMNGWELCEALCNNPALADIPVVVVSATPTELSNLYGASYLPKPVDIENLLAVVDEHGRPGAERPLSGRAPSPSR
jgi:CheY-like chemotaxis protein